MKSRQWADGDKRETKRGNARARRSDGSAQTRKATRGSRRRVKREGCAYESEMRKEHKGEARKSQDHRL